MLEIFHYLLNAIQPLLVPLCFICAWGLILMVVWSLWSAAHDSVKVAKKMHQIPCTGCAFFTNDYRLKCTVNPSVANTEAAINCVDYRGKNS